MSYQNWLLLLFELLAQSDNFDMGNKKNTIQNLWW